MLLLRLEDIKRRSIDIYKNRNKDIYKITDLLHEDAEKLLNQNSGSFYVFRFVGIITIRKVCLISYPRYYQETQKHLTKDFDENHEIIKELLAIISKYESLQQHQELLSTEKEIDDFNLLGFTLELLDYYYRYGLYHNSQDIIELNGQGSILWNKTIAEQNMYLSDDTPIYLDFYTENVDINQADIIRQLHTCILTLCCEELKYVLAILDIQPLSLSSQDLSDFEDESYLTYRLHQEYTSQFETRKQHLINKFIDFVNQARSSYRKSNISFVGTTSMNMVWENVCALVKGDCSKKKLADLKLIPPSNNYTTKHRIDDLMPEPIWKHMLGKNHIVKDTLILDLIVIKDSRVEIYDAKYYCIQFDEQGVNKQPSIGDITKQYLYQKAYRPLAIANDLQMEINAFLMPYAGDEAQCLGHVSLDLFEEDNLLPIQVILLSARQMYKHYLAI